MDEISKYKYYVVYRVALTCKKHAFFLFCLVSAILSNFNGFSQLKAHYKKP